MSTARPSYDAAALAGRDDLMKAVAPSLKEQMKLWWDLLSPDGYGYSWDAASGRSVTWIQWKSLPSLENIPSSAQRRSRKLLRRITLHGAGCAMISRTNSSSLGLCVWPGRLRLHHQGARVAANHHLPCKGYDAHKQFTNVLAKENITGFSSHLTLANVARFVYFRNDLGRKFGVWVVRQGEMHFALPFVTGPRGATSDYEPAPHGLPGFAVPVEKPYPCSCRSLS